MRVKWTLLKVCEVIIHITVLVSLNSVFLSLALRVKVTYFRKVLLMLLSYGSMRDSLSFPNLCRSTSSNRSRVFTVKTHLWPFAKHALVFTISSFIRTSQTYQSSIQKLAKLASSIAIMVMDWDSLMTIYVTFQQHDDGGYVIPDCGSPWLHMFILQLLTRKNVLFCIKICTWLSG